MTAYVTTELLKERMTEQKVLDLCGKSDPSQIEILLDQIIARAQSLADSYIMQSCKLPLQQIPPLVQEWTLCIAEYELYKRGPGSAPPEKIRISYEDTLDRLRELAKGDLLLPGEEQTREKVNSSLAVSAESADPNGIRLF